MFEKIEINSETSLLIPSEVDFKKIFQEALIDPSEEIKQQPIAISIRESEYKGNLYPIPFGSYGDFSCIVGASKSPSETKLIALPAVTKPCNIVMSVV